MRDHSILNWTITNKMNINERDMDIKPVNRSGVWCTSFPNTDDTNGDTNGTGHTLDGLSF